MEFNKAIIKAYVAILRHKLTPDWFLRAYEIGGITDNCTSSRIYEAFKILESEGCRW